MNKLIGFVKNRYMSRAVDYVILTLTVFLLTLVWSGFLFGKWVYAIITATALTAIAVCSVYYFKTRNEKPYSYDRLALEFSVRGSKYLVNILKSILKNNVFESGDNYILLDDSIIVVCFRFSSIGLNDVGNILSLALEKERARVFVIARGVDRRAAHILETHDVRLSVVRIRAIYKFLEKNDALPELSKQRKRFSLRTLIDVILSRNNTKNYLFSGVILLAVAFLTPLKIYYLVFGSLSLVLAILTLTPLGKGSSDGKVFDKLNNEIEILHRDEIPKD